MFTLAQCKNLKNVDDKIWNLFQKLKKIYFWFLKDKKYKFKIVSIQYNIIVY